MPKTASILLAAALVALVAMPLPAAPTDKALTATGTIVRVQASARTVVVKLADGDRPGGSATLQQRYGHAAPPAPQAAPVKMLARQAAASEEFEIF